MKKLKKIIISIVVFCVFCVAGSLLWNSINSYTYVLKVNWGVELPKAGAKEIFAYTQPSFHGDGIRYHVIDYPIGNESKKIQDTTFQLEKMFLDSSHPTGEQIKTVEQLLEQIDVSEDVIPDWEKCNLFFLTQEDHSELFLFYWSGTGTVYIVESFH